ncbi:oxygenase MpaB family protein [Lewinella sp. IMCC34183]|uniref:oxygenase MpaB family protein n=1 Tax=Lewinella sp. IMCC34183 TaxID=2248762 RepID=UPI000E233510|nr:oxygenase MpaB family protein [Lewinella sp. IMCC34183]
MTNTLPQHQQAENFVAPTSIVREIWGKGDTILFIFAGAAAEFAVNKAVDWLYFTGRLPADPLGRLFSTVSYARTIVFARREVALRAIDSMAAIHAVVEEKRGRRIPDWAYRDVLFMLIDYSIRAYEVLERPLSEAERREIFTVFHRVGSRMGVRGLPDDFPAWQAMRREHLQANLVRSDYTVDLYRQYRKHLGPVRYFLLREAQALIVPERVRDLLGLRRFSLLGPVLMLYKASHAIGLDRAIKALILPADYKREIDDLDRLPTRTAGQPSAH